MTIIINAHENSIEKNELSNANDQYRVIGISTEHLSTNDMAYLDHIARMENDENAAWDGVPFAFVGKRQEGYFVKMYEQLDFENSKITLPQDQLQHIALTALKAGYRMIEFDCDADSYEQFKSY
ncbi:hypothetical protein [Photobacterium leiognathi]|uniref:DUF5983 family protein n=1 Tax=Photobacterium leiognathi TaxID=553611 RepID=UPI002739CF7F|nr:hypothetical protein [Photobacterium leiognathi]